MSFVDLHNILSPQSINDHENILKALKVFVNKNYDPYKSPNFHSKEKDDISLLYNLLLKYKGTHQYTHLILL